MAFAATPWDFWHCNVGAVASVHEYVTAFNHVTSRLRDSWSRDTDVINCVLMDLYCTITVKYWNLFLRFPESANHFRTKFYHHNFHRHLSMCHVSCTCPCSCLCIIFVLCSLMDHRFLSSLRFASLSKRSVSFRTDSWLPSAYSDHDRCVRAMSEADL